MSEIERVTLPLGGEDVVLTPSARVASKISKRFEGVVPAIDAVRRIDIDGISFVITVGADLSDRAADTLHDKIFAAGLVNLLPPLTRFLSLLTTGGRPLPPQEA